MTENNININGLNIDASTRDEILEEFRNGYNTYVVRDTPEEYHTLMRDFANQAFRNILIQKRVEKSKFEARFRKMRSLYALLDALISEWDGLYVGSAFMQYRQLMLTVVMANDLAKKDYSGTNSPQYKFIHEIFEDLLKEIESEINND